ncbi:hypothetical protein Cgig2_004364 [Carnegiea gigantea]|uniref:Uncharacterized protein n=1 Tax=Carnegiea gigantea TaxID=171969 RepID=A0A9Q1JNY5_9CARY|nr:hypothetical protein Cgig2_004364 [Carnegiea gigantea]
MAVMKPDLLLKQYHPKSSVSLRPFGPCEPGQMTEPSKAARYTAIHLAGGSFTVASGSGITKEYSAGKRYCFSRADLLSLVTALGLGKWLLGLSYGSQQVGAPGNFDPSATISPFHLGTEPPGPNDDSVEELVEAPSEDELLEECPEAELGEPGREEVLELEEATSAYRGTEQGLPNVPSASSSSGDWIRGVDFVFAILLTWKSGT